MSGQILSIRIELCFGIGGQNEKLLNITKDDSGVYSSTYDGVTGPGEPYKVEKQLPTSEIEKILRSLGDINIPAFPEHIMDCDGGFTELIVGGYEGKTQLRWWSVPPRGWEPLDEVVERIFKCCDIEDE